jgi:hypothetical protein
MKNPFPKLYAQDCYGIWNVRSCTTHKRLQGDWSREQARYAAHAINQHDRLVDACRAALPWIKASIEYTGLSVKDPCEIVANELSALLAEEEQ